MDTVMIIAAVMILLIVLFFLGFTMLKEAALQSEKNVNHQSVMAKKYKYLIERMTKLPTAKILVLTDKDVYIRSIEKSVATNFYIAEKGNSVEIKWIAQLSRLGIHEQIWTFDNNASQQKMIEEIEAFLIQKTKQLAGNIL